MELATGQRLTVLTVVVMLAALFAVLLLWQRVDGAACERPGATACDGAIPRADVPQA